MPGEFLPQVFFFIFFFGTFRVVFYICNCENELTIRVDNLDGLLWWIASKEEIKARIKMTQESKEDYEDKIKVLKEKISSTQKKISYLDEKKRRINELYVEGMIDKEEFKNRQNKTLLEAKTYNDSILTYNERIGALLHLMEGNSDTDAEFKRIISVYDDVRCEKDLEIMDEIVKKHIRKVTTTAEWFGKERDKRAVRQNAQLITVELRTGDVKKFIYVARKYKGHRFWWYTEDGREKPLLSVMKIVREHPGKNDPRAFKKLSKW